MQVQHPYLGEHADILFFSRGKGRGHAVPDAAIAAELVERQPSLSITFVSYGLGSDTLRNFGWKVIDLELSEEHALWDSVARTLRVLERLRPRLVVSHEEFWVIPLAKALGVRSVFLTDWFIGAETLQMQALTYADAILFADERGYHDEPRYLKGKITYVGTIFRCFHLDQADRDRRRRELDIQPHSRVVLVVPGGAEFHSEARAPLFDLVLNAFDSLPIAEKCLLWITGEPDYGALVQKTRGLSNIRVLEPHDGFTSTLLAADVVVTKGNRTPILECEAIGVPTVTISFGFNPIDDFRVARVSTNVSLRARGIDSEVLMEHLMTGMSRPRLARNSDTARSRMTVAGHIERMLQFAP